MLPDNSAKTDNLLPPHKPGHLVTAYLLFAYSFPFNVGSMFNVVAFMVLMTLFSGYILVSTRKEGVSLLRSSRKHHPFFFWLLVAFLVSSCISLLNILFADVTLAYKASALWRYYVYLMLAAYTLALARFCIINQLSHIRIFFYFALGMLTLMILQLLVYHFGPPPDPAVWAFHQPFSHHIRDTGNMAEISAVSCIILLLFVDMREKALAILIGLLTLACWTFILWAGGRAGMLFAMLTSLLMMFLAWYYCAISLKRIVLILALCSLALPLSNAFSVFPWNGIKRASETISKSVSSISQADNPQSLEKISNEFSTGRTVIWTVSMNAVKQSPWFGLGPNGYFFIPDRTYGDNPHNLVIQFLVEWGVVGTVLLLLILAYMLWHGIRQLPQAFIERDIAWIICAGVVITLTLNGLVTGTYFMLQPLFCLLTAFAVFPFATIRQLPHNKQSPEEI